VLIVEWFADQAAKVEGIVGYPVGQVRVLGMVPDRFDRVQVRSVGRQPFHGEPVCSRFMQLSHCRAMRIQAVADKEVRAAGQAPQFQQEGQEVGRLHVVVSRDPSRSPPFEHRRAKFAPVAPGPQATIGAQVLDADERPAPRRLLRARPASKP